MDISTLTSGSPADVTLDSNGILTVKVDEDSYSFTTPKGKDLVRLQRALPVDAVDIERIAVMLSVLSVSGLTVDQALDLDGNLLVTLGGLVTKHFRVFNVPPV
jgi:hypothetical protein